MLKDDCEIPPELENIIDSTVKAIKEYGYVVIPSVISTADAEKLSALVSTIVYAEEALERHKSGHQRIRYLAMRNSIFLEPLCNTFVLKVWRKYLGDNIICSSLTANSLHPGSTDQYWHVDYPHWTLTEPYPLFPISGQAIWMLDDFSIENGATAALVGSHLIPYLPKINDGWPEGAEYLTGKKGSVILADGAFWHTSTYNKSNELRSALLVKYISSLCIPQEDMKFQLNSIENPSDLVKQLLGGNQYVPTRPGDKY